MLLRTLWGGKRDIWKPVCVWCDKCVFRWRMCVPCMAGSKGHRGAPRGLRNSSCPPSLIWN